MGQVLVQLYWSLWSCERDKFNPRFFNVCIFESGLLKKLGILRKEKRSVRDSLWNAILLISLNSHIFAIAVLTFIILFPWIYKTIWPGFSKALTNCGRQTSELKRPRLTVAAQSCTRLGRTRCRCCGAFWRKEGSSLWPTWTRANTPDLEKEQGKGICNFVAVTAWEIHIKKAHKVSGP